MSDPGSSGIPNEQAWLSICIGVFEVFSQVVDKPVPMSVLEQVLHAADVQDTGTVIRLLIEQRYLQVSPHGDNVSPGPDLRALGERLGRITRATDPDA